MTINNAAYNLLSSKHHDGSRTRIRLVMFGYAGGRINALMSLIKQLPSWIEVWGAEYPGRGIRWQSGVLNSAQPLLDDLTPGLSALSDKPLVLLGYSMGANIAYRLGLNLHGKILGVIAASAIPPGKRVTDWRKKTDRVLLDHLKALGGIPEEVLSNKTIMDFFLPVVRADLECCLDLNSMLFQPLTCPILSMYGNSDLMVSKVEALLWQKYSGGHPDLSLCNEYPGGHFFHQGIEEQIALDIAAWLSELLNSDGSFSEIGIRMQQPDSNVLQY